MNNFIYSNAPIITINRGDTFISPIFINQGSKLRPSRYYLTPQDKLYFGVMEPNEYFENSIIKKIYTCYDDKNKEGDILLKISPDDTQYLIPGTYYYSIKLYQLDELGNEFVTTVIPKTLFYIV